jgi:hypothetical protein
VPQLNPTTRIQGFEEIAKSYSDEQAIREARRCLQCDLRLQLGCNPAPPESWLRFDEAHINRVPESEGVFKLLDANQHVLSIKGTVNLRQDLLAALKDLPNASLFAYEEEKMYSQRESEMLQQYLKQHGEMPAGEGEDLF